MVEQIDTLVLGCGAAGSTFASKLSSLGFNVAVVDDKEPHQSIRYRIDITENRELEGILNDLKINPSCRKNITEWYSRNSFFTLKSKIEDLYFYRGGKNNSLEIQNIKKCEDNNVKFFFNSKEQKIHFKNNKVSEVEIKHNKKTIIFHPKVLIVGYGHKSNLVEKLKFEHKRVVSLNAYGKLLDNIGLDESKTSIFFDIEYAPGGYFFIGNCKGTCVSGIVLDSTKQKSNIEEYYNLFVNKNVRLHRLLKDSTVKNTFLGSSSTIKVKKRVCGNVLLIGDAGGFLDPLLGYGLRNAIISGYKAAEVVSENLERDLGLDVYEDRIKFLVEEVKKNVVFRNMFNKLSNEDIEKIIDILKKLEYNGINLDELDLYNHKLLLSFIKRPSLFLKTGVDLFKHFMSQL